MFIKQIAIQGFKSYKDQTTFEPLSQHHNVIVGRNGSGKSNFFAAIRFILGDSYMNLTKEERQSLLHESVGGASISGYVEIVLDNEDRRLPVEKDEITLRRTIGLTLDEYALDGKATTKGDIKNLFESIGMTNSNPFFIVPQGRINKLTTMQDKERLDMLKGIAGTKVYEERRMESITTMQQNDIKRAKIGDVLTFIEQRLEQLEEEKDQLLQFQELDGDRRAIEYTIYEREQTDTNTKLEELEEQRKRHLLALDDARTNYADNDTSLAALESEHDKVLRSIDTVEAEKAMVQAEVDDLTARRTQLEMDIKDYEDMQQTADAYKEKVDNALSSLDKQVSEKEHTLAQLAPQHDELQTAQRDVRQKLNAVKIDLESLYAKEARLSQCNSKQQRDAWLQEKMDESNALRQSLQDQIRTCTDENTRATAEQQSLVQRIQDIRNKQAKLKHDKEQALARELDLIDQRDQLTEKRKNLWRDDAALSEDILKHKHELRKADHQLSSSMSKDIAMGLATVTRLVKEHQWQGVYGPLYELFDVDERFITAVEVAAGASLFHVVVDTDDTASKLMEAMQAEKGGRVTFIPLNRVKAPTIEYPTASNAIPLIHKLQFDAQFEKAFGQIFARTIVCPDLEVASTYAKSRSLTVVTLDGDRVDGRGAFTGGFMRLRSTRFEAAKQVKVHTHALRDAQARSKEISSQVDQLNQQLNAVLTDLMLLSKQKKNVDQISTVELEALLSRLARTRTAIADNEKTLNKAQMSLAQVDRKIDNYRTEMQSELTQSLSENERDAVRQHQATIASLRAELDVLNDQQSNIEQQMREIRTQLEQELQPKRNEWLNKQYRLASGTSASEFKQLNVDFDASKRRLARANQVMAALDKKIDSLASQRNKLATDIDELKNMQDSLRQDIVKMEKHIERYLYRRALYTQKKEECNANIRELGVLPGDAYHKFANYGVEKLLRRLHRTNEALQKCSYINRKAFEQFDRFTKHRDQLTARKTELDASAEQINSLVANLDRRKNDAIERTFNEVARHFSTVFQKLVPEGQAELVIQHALQDDAMEVDNSQAAVPSSFDRYSGVAIKASFHRHTDQIQIMDQLSGGQKSLVALALIFAIQQCDPAPFYLFDEIDANLDTQHRTAVADMIHTLSQQAQFITTTFRPEMLNQADKFYGVTFQNKVSRIHTITKNDALGFVEEEQVN